MTDKTNNKLDKLQRFILDLQKDANAVEEQSIQSNKDMRFVNVVGGMWESFLEDEFEDRTKLEFDIASAYLNRFIGEWNQNRVDVEFKPDDSKTSDEDAELMNGIYRSDFRQFSGKMAVDNAVDEAAACGYGAFKLATKFEDERDPENDFQRIEWRPIHNAYNSVFWQNSAKRIDKRDAGHCTEITRFTEDSFEEAHPGKSPVSAYSPQILFFNNNSLNQSAPVYIAKRYEVIMKKETFFIYNNLESGKVEAFNEKEHELVKDELKNNELRAFVRERKIKSQHVDVTVFSGKEILEPTRRISGSWIPIIPIYGYHAYVDGVEWWRGLIRKLMDAARLFNMQVSKLAENSASSGSDIPIFFTEQMQNKDLKKQWADRNTKPYLLIEHATDSDGNIINVPISYLKAPQLDGSTSALMTIVPAFVQDVTGNRPQETTNPDASGKAIRESKKIEDLNTQIINDNIANAIEWSGTVYESIAADGVYTSKRILNTIGRDGTETRKQLVENVLDEETGKLVKANDLNGKKFRVHADVGPQYDTLRQQTVDDLKGMLESVSNIKGGEQYIPAILSTLLENMSGVGLGPLKELNRKNMLLQGLTKPATDEEKELLAQAQQPQEDPNKKLTEAVAEQQLAEAANFDSDSLDNAASANLKQAQTQKVLSDIQIDQSKAASDIEVNQSKARNDSIKTIADIRSQVLKNVENLPLKR